MSTGKSISIKDFDLLKKTMNLTEGENEHEAMAAMRLANKILKRNGLDWDRVLNRVVAVAIEEAPQEDPSPPVNRGQSGTQARGPTTKEMFEAVLDDVSGSFRDTILDIQAKSEKYGGRLTPGQFGVLQRAYARIGQRR